MKEYDFYESAVARMLDRHRFPLPWYVEEAPGDRHCHDGWEELRRSAGARDY